MFTILTGAGSRKVFMLIEWDYDEDSDLTHPSAYSEVYDGETLSDFNPDFNTEKDAIDYMAITFPGYKRILSKNQHWLVDHDNATFDGKHFVMK